MEEDGALGLVRGAQRRPKAALQTSSWPPRMAASGACPGAGLRRPLPGPLPSHLLRFWRRLAWLPAPGIGRWAGGFCRCDLAPSRLPITRGRQPEERSRSLKCNLRLSGEYRADGRGVKQSVFGRHVSPSDAHKTPVPVLEPAALKIPLTTQPIKLAFLR